MMYLILQRKPPVYATGIPLPQLLIPKSGLKRPLSAATPTTKIPVSLLHSHLSNRNPSNHHINNKNDDQTRVQVNVIHGNKNGLIPGGAGQVKFPTTTNDLLLNGLQGEIDKDQINGANKQNLSNLKNKVNVNISKTPSTTRNTLNVISNTTPRVKNSSYRAPSTFQIGKQTTRPGTHPIGHLQNNRQTITNNPRPNTKTTNIPNVSFVTRRTPPLVSSSNLTPRPTPNTIHINTTPNNVFGNIVTGRPGPRPGLAPRPPKDPNVFDLTVSANQNYGNNYNNQNQNNPNGYIQGKL